MLFPSRACVLRTPTSSLSKVSAAVCALALAAVCCGTALAQRPLGIDVSSYQGSADTPPTNIVWTKVPNSNITYAWAKATEGLTYFDADFNYNEINGSAAGVYIGAYHFAHPDTHPGLAGADQEAAYFLSKAGPYIKTNGNYLVPMLDAEVASPGTQADVSAWVNEWCNDIVNYGISNGITLKPVVYTYQSWATSYLNTTVTNWPLWMASPNGQNPQTGAPNATAPWPTWTLWQYGGGTISGIVGACDEDVFNGTAAQFTNAFIIGHATGTSPPPPPAGVTNFWDPGKLNASPGSGGSGTWDITSSNWWHSGGGMAGDIAWSTAGDYAVFSGTGGTVTLGTAINANSVTFSNTAAYTLAGGANTLVMTSPGNIVVPTGASNAITCVVGGVGFNLSGGGILYLNNTGNYSAGETVTGPNTTLATPSDHPTGNQNVTMTLKSGGIYLDLDATANDQYILPGCKVALGTGGGIFQNPNANLTMSNVISGAGSLTYAGTSRILTLTNPTNTYSGGTIVQGGTLKASVVGAFGSTTAPFTVSGGTLDLGGLSHSSGTVTISGGTISDGILTGSAYLGQSGTVSAQLAGTAALLKSTTGTLTLSGTNTYTGITSISSGLLQINADAKLGTPPASPVTNQLTITSGTTTNNFGLRASASFTLNPNRGITLSANGISGGQIQVAQGATLTYAGVITGNGSFEDGTGTTIGYGTLVLSGANNYTGSTTIAAGTLQLGASGTLPSGTPLTIASANIGGTLDLNGFSQTIGPLTSSTGINGTGTVAPGILLTGALTINESSSSTFAGNISGSGGSLTLTGNGTLTLGGTNNYTGNTTISSGTLALGATGSLINTAQINIAPGATFDVSAISSYTLGSSTTLSAGGNATAATLKGGTTINLGSQPIHLTYDGAHPALSISQGPISLNGNPFTVNNASGSPLGAGIYTLIQQSGVAVISSGTSTVTVTGSGIAPGTSAAIGISGGSVNLVVAAPTAFSGLSPSQSIIFGATGITLAGTVSGPGPTYPAMGETVAVSINGNVQSTAIADATGDFSFSYNPSTIPASGLPYAITYSYAGPTLSAASATSTALTVNQLPVALAGSRPYDGTTNAAAAILSVTNIVGTNSVTVASGTATLAGANVGPENIAAIGTLTLSGPAAGNYTLVGASGVVTITVPTFSVAGSVDVAGGNFIITWPSAPGGVYQVVGSTNLSAILSTWTNVGAPITATDTNTSATNAITSSSAFFDVIGH